MPLLAEWSHVDVGDLRWWSHTNNFLVIKLLGQLNRGLPTTRRFYPLKLLINILVGRCVCSVQNEGIIVDVYVFCSPDIQNRLSTCGSVSWWLGGSLQIDSLTLILLLNNSLKLSLVNFKLMLSDSRYVHLLSELLVSFCTTLTWLLLSCNCINLLGTIVMFQTCLRGQAGGSSIIPSLALRVVIFRRGFFETDVLKVCLVCCLIWLALSFSLVSRYLGI